ncbi:MAG: PorT family protein [Cytophagaceae bacterium]|nr:PorT family protein [Cytophagaceae bacterium]
MKKTGLLFIFCLLTFNAFSQVKFSLKLSPAVALTRVTDKENALPDASSNGAGGAFVGGAALDFFITDNLAFNLGLNYVATQVNAKYYGGGSEYSFKRSVQYVQVPVTLKAFTNEIATDMQLYFQLGPTMNFKISEKLKSKGGNFDLDDDDHKIISPVDVGLYFGAGVLYKVGESNALFAGFYYNRGLTNVTLTNTDNGKYSDWSKTHMDLIGLEAGIRF